MAIRDVLLALACAACAGYGRRLQGEARSSQPDHVIALGNILSAAAPGSSFQLPFAASRQASAWRSRANNRIAPCMSETVEITRRKVNALLEEGADLVGQEVLLKGWVRTIRNQKAFSFIEVNDGSSLQGLQVVADSDIDSYGVVEGLTTGAAVSVLGNIVESQGGGQSIEVKASVVELVGACPSDTYPLQKKRHSLEFLRTIAHLRPRTNLMGAVSRVRSSLAQATHAFFAQEGFQYVQTPLISASDCEGAGEMFRVTTLDPAKPPETAAGMTEAQQLALKSLVETQGKKVRAAKEAVKEGSGDKDTLDAEVDTLLKLKEVYEEKTADDAADKSADVYAKDFFSRQAFLTVSGQLSAETYALALGDVYTFGPTFRAENSMTTRHLAEFWMIEPEMAFADLSDDMANAEKFVKYVVRYAMEHNKNDMELFTSFVDKGLKERLEKLVNEPFARVSYREAIKILQEEIAKDPKKWEYPDVEFGTDLSTEHERWLAEEKFKTAVFVYNYPKAIKSFYMRDNDDGDTVAAMDLLVPGVGELIGGSQREERLDRLLEKMADAGLEEKDYWWYVDLRRYGSVPHSGYGLGFERLVCYVTGVGNIRDAIAFPRYPGSCEF